MSTWSLDLGSGATGENELDFAHLEEESYQLDSVLCHKLLRIGKFVPVSFSGKNHQVAQLGEMSHIHIVSSRQSFFEPFFCHVQRFKIGTDSVNFCLGFFHLFHSLVRFG